MSLGTWSPDAETAPEDELLAPATLERLAGYARDERLDDLEKLIQGDDCQRLAALMRVEHPVWEAAAETLPDTTVLELIRCLAVAENLPGWEAGEHSPVIPLARVLRRRGNRLDRDMLRWLRTVNDNRYLPYGPL